MDESAGELFQKESSYTREWVHGRKPDRKKMSEPYKEYPEADAFKLPLPDTANGRSFNDLLKIRKSVRKYTDEPLPAESLSYLLWAADGIQRREKGFEFRTAPSAGALFPVETYLAVNNVETLPAGIYHYNVRNHSLELVKQGEFRKILSDLTLSQDMCASANVVFIWTAIFDRSRWKSANRTYRYVYLDAGHIAQNLALAACNLGLGSCQIGSFFDREMDSLLGIDGKRESTIYVTVVGHPDIR
ncbi:MAG: SagB/ThcOx family dehydrogenase [Candidatus Xenobiia bacterium LiM19]